MSDEPEPLKPAPRPELLALASAVRDASEIAYTRSGGIEDKEDRHAMYRVADLAAVLARLLEGKTLYRAMGVPGDWGYESAIGAAYAKALDGVDYIALRGPVEKP